VDSDTQDLLDLLAGKSAAIELDRVALEIARIEYPDLVSAPHILELDRLAWTIAERAGDLSDGPRFVETANAYLFGEAGFRGNEKDYYNPANSCLNRVLETKFGIPITLSVVYLEIARRLAMPVHGVGLPMHFLVRYDDADYQALIDPFHDGTILTEAQCCLMLNVESIDPALFQPVDRRQIAIRMLNNLRGIYLTRGESHKALLVLDLLIAADPESADEHRQRGAVLVHERRLADALASFQKYLALSPNASDRENVEEQMRNIAFWMASRN
jgi:regulator of sirC expression with transglutaminase-like and TPR domain